jgi:hypothetical protein
VKQMPREEEEIERDEEDDEVEEAAPPPNPPKQAPPQRIATAKNKKHTSKGLGQNDSWLGDPHPREADLLWATVLERLPAVGRGPYDVRIQILQMDPPIGNSDSVTLGYFSGGNVAGTPEMPGSLALIHYITDYFHMPRPQSRGSVRYQVRFLWAQNSQNFTRGDLTLPPREEIIALRNAETAMRRQQGEPVAAYVPPPLSPQQAPQGFGAPQTPSGSQQNPSYYPPPDSTTPALMQMMMEMFRASQEQRQPQITPAMLAGLAAPPPVVSEDAIISKTTAAVLGALEKAGFLKPPQGVASVTPVAPVVAATPTTSLEKAFSRLMDTAVNTFIGGVEKNIKQTLTGVGAPPPEAEEPEETIAPTPPDDGLPYRAAKVNDDVKWGDGRHVMYAADKESGDFDWKGFLMSNPTIAEKGMEIVGKLGEAAAEAVKRVGTQASAGLAGAPTRQIPQPAAEVVSSTPSNAVDATPGNSWKEG